MYRFALLSSGVIVLHTLVTILEESLFSNESFLRDAGGAFMTLVMYSVSVVWYLLLRVCSLSRRSHAAPLRKEMLYVVTLYVGTTTLTKSSLRYIDMPTQTVLKSTKLIPVMVGSVAILHKSFSLREWFSALMLVTGVTAFNLSSNMPSAPQTAMGIVCIFVALVCDALLGNVQKKVLSSGTTVDDLMLLQSAGGMVYMFVVCWCTSSLSSGFRLLFTDLVVCGARTSSVLLVFILRGPHLPSRLSF